MRLEQVYSGRSHYYPDHTSGPHRLLVAVACYVEDLDTPVHALLDMASEWCVLPPEVVGRLKLDPAPVTQHAVLHTRFGTMEGRIERLRLRFPADEGDALETEATGFVSEDWPGPMVIGWKGCLEWIRFAIDPGENAFYFAAL